MNLTVLGDKTFVWVCMAYFPLGEIAIPRGSLPTLIGIPDTIYHVFRELEFPKHTNLRESQ